MAINNYYDVNTLKVFADGKEIAFKKNSNYNADAPLNEAQIAGTITVENITKDVKITFACQERELSVRFKVNEENGADISTYLKEFKLDDNKTLYQALLEPTYSYKTTYTEYVENVGIELTGPIIGKYAFSFNDASTGTGLELVATENGSFKEQLSAARNEYVLFFGDISLTNEILINTEAIVPNGFYINNQSAELLTVSKDGEISFDELGTVTVTCNAGLDLSGAKLYVNDTEVEMTDGTFIFEASKLPVQYVSDENLVNFFDYTSFNVRLEGATFANN